MSRTVLLLLFVTLAALFFTVQGQEADVLKAKAEKIHVHIQHGADKEDLHARRVINRIVDRVGKEHRSMLHKLEHALAAIRSGGKATFNKAAELAADAKEARREKKQRIKFELKRKLQAAIRRGDKKFIRETMKKATMKLNPKTAISMGKKALLNARTPGERKALEKFIEQQELRLIDDAKKQKEETQQLKAVSTSQAQQEIEKLLNQMKNPEKPNAGIVMHGKKCKKTMRNRWPVELDEYGGKMTKSQLDELRSMHDRVNGMLEANPKLTIVEKILRGATKGIQHAHDQHVWLRQDALPQWAEEPLVSEEIQDAMAGRWIEAANIQPF